MGGIIAAWQTIVWNTTNPAPGWYTLVGYINTSGGNQQALIQADDGTGVNVYCRTALTNTMTWQRYTCSFLISGGRPQVNVVLIASNAPGTQWGWVNFDDVCLTNAPNGSWCP
jgi:hypothetical protein